MLGTEKSPGWDTGAEKTTHAKFNGSKHSAQDYIEQFRKFARQKGFELPAEIIANGEVQRCGPNDACAYVLHLDGVPNGWVQDWRQGGRQDTSGRQTGESSIMRNASAPTLKLRRPRPSVMPRKQIRHAKTASRSRAYLECIHTRKGRSSLSGAQEGQASRPSRVQGRARCPDLA